MTRQQTQKLVWSKWSHLTSSASFNSSASSVQDTRKFAQLSAWRFIISFARFLSRFSTLSSTSSFLRSSSARNLQRFFIQIASLSSVSSIFISIFVLSAQDARDLRRKLKQRLSVSSSCFLSRIYLSHDSSRSSSRYSSARDSRWTLTWNASFFSSRSFAWTSSYDSFIFSFFILSSHDTSARIFSSDSLWSSSHDLFIKSCLFMKNLYVMFHRLSKKEHTLQSQR